MFPTTAYIDIYPTALYALVSIRTCAGQEKPEFLDAHVAAAFITVPYILNPQP